jgi:hypothetical protein
MPTKKQRAIDRIEEARKIYANGTDIGRHSFVLDLLVDLHHYCAEHSVDMSQSIQRAEFIYNQESKS